LVPPDDFATAGWAFHLSHSAKISENDRQSIVTYPVADARVGVRCNEGAKMPDTRTFLPGSGGRLFWVGAALIAVVVFASPRHVLAENRTHRLQGLFCNTEGQIDETLAHMHGALSPRTAVDLPNDDAVACTFVDLLHHVIDRPTLIGQIPGSAQLFKYQGTLIGVVVCGTLRPVTPPVHLFFVVRERLSGTRAEGRA